MLAEPVKQTSAEPLDCSVRQMKIKVDSNGSVRASERAVAGAPRCQQRVGSRQRRALVRQAAALRSNGVRTPLPRKARRLVVFAACAGFARATVFGPRETPNKSPEPTSLRVTPPAYAGVAPLRAVAHL